MQASHQRFRPFLIAISRRCLTPGVQIVHDRTERLLGLLVQVGNGDPRSENSIVRVLGRQVSSSLRGEVVQFDSGHSLVDTGCYLLGNPASAREEY